VIVKLSGREFTAQNVFTGVVCIFGFLTAIANLGTSLYYLAVMPRLPEPVTGRIYLAGAAFNTGVYVNKGEFAWLNFLHYDMISVVGISVVLLAIFAIIPKAVLTSSGIRDPNRQRGFLNTVLSQLSMSAYSECP
jgi:hypothetical protein